MSRVMIVSDDEATSDQVRAALPDEMYQLIVATDGSATLEQATAEDLCDLLLIDRSTVAPELYGRFLAYARSSEVPLIALGRSVHASEWAGLLHEGASSYLTTPIDADALAAQVAVFLRIKERHDQLRAQAVIDELTGVYNRRYLDEQMTARLAEAQRYSAPFSIGLVDIDHFKRVNDTYGHQAGDKVLAETAGLIRRQMRKEDLLARYGGEEFAVMLPHTDRLGAAILAERVREAIAEHDFVVPSATITITVSMGLASFPLDPAADDAELLRIADTRLYEAKAGGRNQTVFE